MEAVVDTDTVSDIVNPLTGEFVKVGSKTHKRLITSNVLDRTTLDHGKRSIVGNSRRKRSFACLEYYKTTTHWTNAMEICVELEVPFFNLIDYISKEFIEFKLCYNLAKPLIIFPGIEKFVDTVDFNE